MKGRYKFLITVGVLAAALGGTYAYGCERFKGKYLPNTYINGYDYTGMTVKEAEDLYAENWRDLKLTYDRLDGTTESIAYADFDYIHTMDMNFQQVYETQDYKKWPLAYINKTVINTPEGYQYNRSKLEQLVWGLECVSSPDIQDPVNAAILKGDSGYYLRESSDGNRLDVQKVISLTVDSVNNMGQEINLEKEGCYKKAQVRTDNEALQKQIAALDKIQNVKLDISLEGGVFVPLDNSTFLDWITYDPNSGTAGINGESLKNYVAGLAAQYDTWGTQRQFHTTGGDVVTVGGDPMDSYGFKLNQEGTVERIRTALLSGTSQTVEGDFDHYGLTRDSVNEDIGNTYIEISIQRQHMWYYVDGVLQVDTDVVTGKYSDPSRRTPSGVFGVLDKLRDHTMSGSYGSSFCHYCIAFNWDGICIHDSSWRSSYGGSIYIDSGSHGCVNTPIDKVRQIYDQVHLNTPIVIY